MLKTFFTYEQQLNKLQHEKGLIIIPNPASNKRNYSNINRLVNSMKKSNCNIEQVYIYCTSCQYLRKCTSMGCYECIYIWTSI